jgi:hypothetical protein
MEGTEGTFLACSFWLAECLAKQGRLKETHEVFKTALAAGNHLCLFPEEFDPHRKEMLGNSPRGLTHLSLISEGWRSRRRKHRRGQASSDKPSPRFHSLFGVTMKLDFFGTFGGVVFGGVVTEWLQEMGSQSISITGSILD